MQAIYLCFPEVLSLVFDYLSQEIDAKLVVRTHIAFCMDLKKRKCAHDQYSCVKQEQYRGIRTIVVKSIHLLRYLAKGNDLVQKRIYDRMDALLKVQVVESEIASALKEVKFDDKLYTA